VIRMGERPDTILNVGCPSSDIARQLDRTLLPEVINQRGSGAFVDTAKPFQLVIFHPTTTEYGSEERQMHELLTALRILHQPTVLLWPNIDAGSNHVSKLIRQFRDQWQPEWLRTLINLSPEEYLKVLANTACAIGNSSSFVRDAGYFGTPVVLVGNRQEGRETDSHVVATPPVANEIVAAVSLQLRHGRYAPSKLYGDGHVSEQIAESLAALQPYIQKRLFYIHEMNGHARKEAPVLGDCPAAASDVLESETSCVSSGS